MAERIENRLTAYVAEIAAQHLMGRLEEMAKGR